MHTATRWNMDLEMNVEKSGAGESEKDTYMVQSINGDGHGVGETLDDRVEGEFSQKNVLD